MKNVRLGLICFLLLQSLLSLSNAMAATNGVDMAVLLDRSGSMKRNDREGLSIPATLFLLDQLELAGDQNRASLLLFDSKTRVIPEKGLTSDFSSLRKAILKIALPGGLTEMEMALSETLRLFKGSTANEKMVVLITDGVPMPNPDLSGRFPDPRDQNAIKAYRARAQKATGKALWDLQVACSQKLRKSSIKNIQEGLLPAFQEKNIRIYPLGLTQGVDTGFLGKVALETTRNEKGFMVVSTNRDLVPALSQLVPLPQSVIRLFDSKQESQVIKDKNSWQKAINVEIPASYLRFMVVYPTPKESDHVFLSLVDPDGRVLSSENPGEADYVPAKDRNKDKVFERFIIRDPKPGTWHVRLSNSKPIYVLPESLVTVDARTSLRLHITANPCEAAPGTKVILRAALEDTGGNHAPLDRVDVDLRHESGRHYSERLKPIPGMTGVLEGSFLVPRDAPVGDYLVHAKGIKGRSGSITAETSFKIIPLSPVGLFCDIPYGMGKLGESMTNSIEKDRLAFEPIGDKVLNASIKGVTIRTDSTTPIPVFFKLSSLEQDNGDQILDPRRWTHLSRTKGVTSEKRPFTLNVSAGLPATIPEELRSGRFTGSLTITSPRAREPLEVPIILNLNIPELVAVRNEDKNGLHMCIKCSSPGEKTYDLKIRSTSLIEQPVYVNLPPFLFTTEERPVPREQLALELLNQAPMNFQVPPKGKEAEIHLRANLLDQTLPKGAYHGTMILQGQRVRSLTIPIEVEVPQRTLVNILRMGSTILGGLALLCLVIFAWRFIRHRPFFSGSRLQWSESDIRNTGASFQRYFHLQGTNDGVIMTSTHPSVTCNGKKIPSRGKKLKTADRVRAGRFSFQFSVSSIDVSAAILQSPYSRLLHQLPLVLAALALLLGMAGIWKPMLLCPLFGG